MRHYKTEWIVVTITLVLAASAISYFLGRSTVAGVDGEITVLSELPASASQDALKAPEETAEDADTEKEADAAEETDTLDEAESAETPTHSKPGSAELEAEREALAGLVDINSADADALSDLPGIGTKLAERIVAYREENGRFTDVSELTEVEGIGEGKLEGLLDLIYVGE